MATKGRMHLPIVRKIELRDFSLYQLAPIISEEVRDGVFCLAGANGLGKSTFLAAVNYAITGIVSDPERKFESAEDYYRYSLDFAREYFTGRIRDQHRETAEVTLEMEVAQARYRITRGVFAPAELRELKVVRKIDDEEETLIPSLSDDSIQLHKQYEQNILRDTGLASFSQLVFLQHFVLTFDERRHLLFWDQKALEQALFLAFGVDAKKAEEAGNIRRKTERLDSRARNFRWQATTDRNKARMLRDALGGGDGDDDTKDLFEAHSKLMQAIDESRQKVERRQEALNDSLLQLAELSSKEATLRSAYEAEFARVIKSRPAVSSHPAIVQAISLKTCDFCGAEGAYVARAIQSELDNKRCPFCSSTISSGSIPSCDIESLREVDEKIKSLKKPLTIAHKKADRLRGEVTSAQEELKRAERECETFETRHNKIFLKQGAGQGNENVQRTIKDLEKRAKELDEKADVQRLERDLLKKDLNKLHREIEGQYSNAQEIFVPLFKELAHRFLGLDLDISMEMKASSGINLFVEVNNDPRRQHHELSESQRFFLDIALRMALADYMVPDSSRACLYIDTPEGSLDIAYEARAGDMFAEFVKRGHNIIMTANINTSQILLNLAGDCGRSKMILCRMTEWAELSDVQRAEEIRFEDAYNAIEKALARS